MNSLVGTTLQLGLQTMGKTTPSTCNSSVYKWNLFKIAKKKLNQTELLYPPQCLILKRPRRSQISIDTISSIEK